MTKLLFLENRFC